MTPDTPTPMAVPSAPAPSPADMVEWSALPAEVPALAAALDQRPRLLVVDDQPVNVQALYQAFAADHQVFMATNGAQALALCESKQPDIVLLDVMMPGMDGYEVCERLKAQDSTRHIPVIFVTAHHDEDAETRGLDLGAVDFISKPINPRIVRARVRTQLTLKRQADLLRQWVYIDGLTGVANRRYFDECLDNECRRSLRDGSPLSLALVDVDLFKRYNDRYGHQAGDDCLRKVAAALKATLQRSGDLLARYGGEEFACILPGTERDGALALARRLNAAVINAAVPHADSDVSPVVTVSIGVGCKPADGLATVSALLREADAQLYIAKSRGRNRACAAELPQP